MPHPGLIGIAALLASVQAAAPPAPEPPAPTIPLVPIETRMAVSVMVNGAGPFRFIVDSGASHTVLSRQLAATLHLPGGARFHVHSVGSEAEVTSARIDALAIGDLPPQAIVAPLLDQADLGAAGILGIDMLADKRVLIDLDRHAMTITRSEQHAARGQEGEIVVTARRRSGELILVDADAGGHPIYAIVDTGSAVTIGNEALARHLARKSPERVTLHDVTGYELSARFAPAGDIRIGGVVVRNVVAAFSDAQVFRTFRVDDRPAMLLGMDLLAGFRQVSIDFPRKTVRLLRQRTRITATSDRPWLTSGG